MQVLGLWYAQAKFIISLCQCWQSSSSSVSVSLEAKPQLQNVIVELTFESMFPRVFPLPVHYFEGNVLQTKRDVCVWMCVCVCNEWVHGSSVYTIVGHTSYGGPAWKRRIAKSLLSAQGVCEESEGIIVKFGRTAKTIYPTVIGTKTITYQCVFRSFTFVDEIRIEHLQIWQTLE